MAMDRNTKTVMRLVAVGVTMGALAWASVPLYDWFCRVTGYGGETNVADLGSDEILDRTIKVRFDASNERGFPWEFKPVQREMEIRIGETGLAFYERITRPIVRLRDRPPIMSPRSRPAASLPRSIASALRSRFCNRASACRCR